MEQVTCKSCKHNTSGWLTRNLSNSVWWNCDLAENYEPKEYNPVDGKTRGGYFRSCSVARGIESICGRDGKQWVPRSKKDLFIFMKRI